MTVQEKWANKKVQLTYAPDGSKGICVGIVADKDSSDSEELGYVDVLLDILDNGKWRENRAHVSVHESILEELNDSEYEGLKKLQESLGQESSWFTGLTGSQHEGNPIGLIDTLNEINELAPSVLTEEEVKSRGIQGKKILNKAACLKLVELADSLDRKGHMKEANEVDEIMKEEIDRQRERSMKWVEQIKQKEEEERIWRKERIEREKQKEEERLKRKEEHRHWKEEWRKQNHPESIDLSNLQIKSPHPTKIKSGRESVCKVCGYVIPSGVEKGVFEYLRGQAKINDKWQVGGWSHGTVCLKCLEEHPELFTIELGNERPGSIPYRKNELNNKGIL